MTKRMTENKALLGMAVELQKIVTLELHNITISAVGSETDSDLAKDFSSTVSDFTKPQNTAG